MRIPERARQELAAMLATQCQILGEERLTTHRLNCEQLTVEENPFKRFCWDIFHTIPNEDRWNWIERQYLAGHKDSHIETVLRHELRDYKEIEES